VALRVDVRPGVEGVAENTASRPGGVVVTGPFVGRGPGRINWGAARASCRG